ncbi:MAG: DUF4838 domain-containing protein [Lentisphaeria bacterium]|nr:DUF4838 domain-containing protein [Lentisphaeria bacterium]
MTRAVAAICLCLLNSVALGERVALVESGVPTATIVLPSDAGPVLKKAAAELSGVVKKLTGVALPVRSAAEGVLPGAALVLGDKEAPLPPVVQPREQHALESFSLRVRDGNVHFGGRSPEAITYGVLAFIEGNLGVRWFAPGALWEYLPPHKKGELTVEVASRVVTPDTPLRVMSCSGIGPSWQTWMWQNRAKSLTKGIRSKYSSNMIHRAFPAEAYAETHPEYYPLIRGKRVIPPAGRLSGHSVFWPCVSNPDVVTITAEYLRNWFDSHPDETSFSLGMNDVTRHCRCPECIAMDRDPRAIERDDLADRTCAFINAVAGELKKTHPKRYIGLLFYRHTYKAPAKIVKLEDTVFGYITCEASSWWGEDGAQLEAADKEMAGAWAQISSLPLSRYEYLGLGTFTPVFYPHAMDRQMKFDLKMGMEGQYTEFYTFLSNTAPMAWAFFQLQWNAALDLDTLLHEFYSKMFGESAGAMAEYYAFLEHVWSTPRPGRKGGFLILSRNIDEQCTAISPDEIQKGLELLDRALAAAQQDKVRKRIEIVRASLKFAEYGVESYWRARDLRSIRIKSLSQAEDALAHIAEYPGLIKNRTTFWAEAEERQDILGESIRALKSHRYLMADSLAFNRIDKAALIPMILNVLDWYRKNAPDKLPKARQALDTMALPESIGLAAKAYGNASGAANLLDNPGFGEVGSATRQETANDDWDHAGAPKGWNVWIRPRGRRGLPLSKANIQRKAGRRRGSSAAALSAGTGGCFIASIEVKSGAKYFGSVWLRAGSSEAATKSNLTLKFKDADGKLMDRDARKRLQYEKIFGVATKEWQRLAVCVTVPKGAETLCVMLGHDYAEEDIIFDDALLLLAEKASQAPESSDFEVVLAEGVFKTRVKGRLSGRGVRKVEGRGGGSALAFTPGGKGENSFLKIANVARGHDFTKAMTIEAWVQVDRAYRKGTLEIIGNPVTDRGRGFRLYLNRGVLHFISGSGGDWKNAKTWGAHSDERHLIKPGKWHHIAASYDGSVFKVFVDGVLAGTSSVGLKLTKGKPAICIGSFRDGLVYGFMGKMADLNIHDKALHQDESKRRAEKAQR